MSRIKRIRIKTRKYIPAPGASPGSITLFEDAVKPRILLHYYNETEYHSTEITSIEDLDLSLSEHKNVFKWLDIRGIGDIKLLSYVENNFNINKLVIEDIADCRQRPKLDEYQDYLFTVSRMIYVNKDLEIENEQVSMILLSNVLITFQESHEDIIAPVITRLKAGKGNIRTGGSSYLMYTLTDVIIDNYFSLLYKLGAELDTIEGLLFKRPSKTLMLQTQNIKREITMLRRSAWPERDKINDMIRSDSKLINKVSRSFLKDTYDHCMQVIDLVETYKDISTSLIDLNFSMISHRMNEVMKVLTIVSSIFIPLTFIAGVYGMNFAYRDPKTGEVLHLNMPELYAEHGYVLTLSVMLIIALVQLLFFWKKGWLNSNS